MVAPWAKKCCDDDDDANVTNVKKSNARRTCHAAAGRHRGAIGQRVERRRRHQHQGRGEPHAVDAGDPKPQRGCWADSGNRACSTRCRAKSSRPSPSVQLHARIGHSGCDDPQGWRGELPGDDHAATHSQTTPALGGQWWGALATSATVRRRPLDSHRSGRCGRYPRHTVIILQLIESNSKWPDLDQESNCCACQRVTDRCPKMERMGGRWEAVVPANPGVLGGGLTFLVHFRAPMVILGARHQAAGAGPWRS